MNPAPAPQKRGVLDWIEWGGRAVATQAVSVLPANATVVEGATVLAREPLTVIAEDPPRLSESPAPCWSQVIVPIIMMIWYFTGAPLGPASPLHYLPSAG